MGKTRRNSSKESSTEEYYEGQTKRDYSRKTARKKQRKFKEALRSKNLDAIEYFNDDIRY